MGGLADEVASQFAMSADQIALNVVGAADDVAGVRRGSGISTRLLPISCRFAPGGGPPTTSQASWPPRLSELLGKTGRGGNRRGAGREDCAPITRPKRRQTETTVLNVESSFASNQSLFKIAAFFYDILRISAPDWFVLSMLAVTPTC